MTSTVGLSVQIAGARRQDICRQRSTDQAIVTYLEPLENIRVRLVAYLSAAALRRKLDKELAIWHCLRSIDVYGHGVLDMKFVKDALIEVFGYSERTLKRHLKSGEGSFWQRFANDKGHRIKITGIKTIAEYLNTPTSRFDKNFREIPSHKFQSLTRRRSQLYASIHKPKGIRANPISRQSIEECTGLNKVQQRRYEIIAGVKRTSNFGIYSINNEAGKREYRPETQLIITKNQEYTMQKRLPNIYHCDAQLGRRGMLRKVSVGQKGESLMSEEATTLKRYFRGFKWLLSAIKGHPNSISEGYIITPAKQRVIRGRLEWQHVWF